ncbi:MAG: WecB/TagA/CpsF family glycosyltransferase [Alicyclobacillaceae bacterium]|nr:WecB/TagA/CpsF family glycosyltransferase [Alicyclobacillaceae bacterium]
MGFANAAGTVTDTVVRVLDVRFHGLPESQVVEQILYWVAEKSRRMVITAGPEFVMMARRDPEVARIARSADLVTPDGIGIVWAAKMQGKALPGRVTGVEVVCRLLETAARRKQRLRVFLLGASQASLNRCLAVLGESFPMHVFAGRDGYFRADELPQVMAEVAAFRPDLWLVGLGQPRQEKLIFQQLGSLPPCVAIGVGGSIDVWGGTVKRAPALLRRMNLEWLYRLVRQPSRWRRQLALPQFAWQVLKDAARRS